MSNEHLSQLAVPFESVFSAAGDDEPSLLANGNDVEILNENAMIYGFPFSILEGYTLGPLFPEIWSSLWPPIFHPSCLILWRNIILGRMARNTSLFMIASLFLKHWRRVLLVS